MRVRVKAWGIRDGHERARDECCVYTYTLPYADDKYCFYSMSDMYRSGLGFVR